MGIFTCFLLILTVDSCFQVSILLYVCQWLVALMWRCKIDPDSGAIPYLTALGDLLGQDENNRLDE